MNKDRIMVTLGLLGWLVLMTLANGIDRNTIVALILGIPVYAFAFYLIWFDSKKPFDKQWRYVNRKRRS